MCKQAIQYGDRKGRQVEGGKETDRRRQTGTETERKAAGKATESG